MSDSPKYCSSCFFECCECEGNPSVKEPAKAPARPKVAGTEFYYRNIPADQRITQPDHVVGFSKAQFNELLVKLYQKGFTEEDSVIEFIHIMLKGMDK